MLANMFLFTGKSTKSRTSSRPVPLVHLIFPHLILALIPQHRRGCARPVHLSISNPPFHRISPIPLSISKLTTLRTQPTTPRTCRPVPTVLSEFSACNGLIATDRLSLSAWAWFQQTWMDLIKRVHKNIFRSNLMTTTTFWYY